MSSLGQLASELIQLILDYIDTTTDLYACTLVNKSFYIQTNPLLWQHLDMYSNDKLDTLISSMNNNTSILLGQQIRSITISSMISDTHLTALVPHLQNVEHLQLDNATNITDTSFQHVPSYCPHIVELTIRGSGITTKTMQHVIQHYAPTLTSLTLDRLLWLDYLNFLPVCPLLNTLDLTPPDTGSDLEEYITFPSELARKVSPQSTLTCLSIRGVDYDYSDFLLAATVDGWWPHLTTFHLDRCNIDDDTVMALVKAYPYLQDLALNGNEFMTDTSLVHIATWLHGIQKLDMNGVEQLTLIGLRYFVKMCGMGLIYGVGCSGIGLFLDHDDACFELYLWNDDDIDDIDYELDRHLEMKWMATKKHATTIRANGGRR